MKCAHKKGLFGSAIKIAFSPTFDDHHIEDEIVSLISMTL